VGFIDFETGVRVVSKRGGIVVEYLIFSELIMISCMPMKNLLSLYDKSKD